jgi:simple sugar transport system permease protein
MSDAATGAGATRASAARVAIEFALAMAAALLCGAILILLAGANPLTGYVALVSGAFGSLNSVAEVLVKATPLTLAGLGVALAFRAGYWNIGAEGQIFMGALGATWVGLNVGGWPASVALPAAVAVGFLTGGVWGLIPGVLRVRLGASEIITTIMFNYIALLLVNYVITGPLKESEGFLPETDPIASAAALPRLFPPTRLHAGVLIALAATGILYWLMIRSTFGFRVRMVGMNPEAARYAGASVTRTWIVVSLLAGGLAGLAGAAEVAGVHRRLIEDISGGYGFTAIVVALLGWLHPLGVVLAAILFAALRVGADAMQRAIGVPVTLVYIIQALVILLILCRNAVDKDSFRKLMRRLRPV